MVRKINKDNPIPIWERALITVEEGTALTGIGYLKLRAMSNEPGCEYVVWIGASKMLKRRKLEEYLENSYSV